MTRGCAACTRVVAEAEALHDAGPERLDDDVGGAEQPIEDVFAVGRLQVDGERTPAAVPHAVAVVRAERVAAGRLDLDDVGALLGEQQHAERAGDSPREIEDADTVECTGHARAPAHLAASDALTLPDARVSSWRRPG